MNNQITPPLAALLTLVGVLMRANRHNGIFEFMFKEGIPDSYMEAFREGLKQLRDANLTQELERCYGITLPPFLGTSELEDMGFIIDPAPDNKYMWWHADSATASESFNTQEEAMRDAERAIENARIAGFPHVPVKRSPVEPPPGQANTDLSAFPVSATNLGVDACLRGATTKAQVIVKLSHQAVQQMEIVAHACVADGHDTCRLSSPPAKWIFPEDYDSSRTNYPLMRVSKEGTVVFSNSDPVHGHFWESQPLHIKALRAMLESGESAQQAAAEGAA